MNNKENTTLVIKKELHAILSKIANFYKLTIKEATEEAIRLYIKVMSEQMIVDLERINKDISKKDTVA